MTKTLHVLVSSETACQLSYIANNDDDVSNDIAQCLPQPNDDQQPVELTRNEQATSDTENIMPSLEPVAPDDSSSLSEAELQWATTNVITESDHALVNEENDVASAHQSMIPCEFCLELFDKHLITEHQDVCYRQQTSALQAILDAGNTETASAANRYRYPYSVMTLDEREHLGQL